MGEIAKQQVSQKIYEEIRFKFILGETLKSLSEQYNISYATLKDRSHREKWGLLRDVKDKEAGYEYRRALVDKNYDYIKIYTIKCFDITIFTGKGLAYILDSNYRIFFVCIHISLVFIIYFIMLI